MARAEEELRETETRLRSLDQQVVYLDAQLAQLSPASQIFTDSGERVLSPSDRLKVLKSDYARASAIYAPDHPDVTRMKREIDGLEREVGKVETGNDLARQLREAQGQLAQAREKYAPDHPDVQQLERLVECDRAHHDRCAADCSSAARRRRQSGLHPGECAARGSRERAHVVAA